MWLQYLVQALSMIPYVVSGIEHIHGSAISGASKKELAMQALGLSSTIAAAVDPQHQASIAAASSLASTTIDGVVAVMNASKEAPAPAPAPAPAKATVQAKQAPAAVAAVAQVHPISASVGSAVEATAEKSAPSAGGPTETGGSAADVIFPSD